MSRITKGNGSSNPIKKYISLNGNSGEMSYKQDKKKVKIKELNLIWLSDRVYIGGYVPQGKIQFNSNRVEQTDLRVTPLKVYKSVDGGKTEVLAEGIYSEIKPKLEQNKCKYSKEIIGLADLGDGLEMVSFSISGSKLYSWNEFEDSGKAETHKVIFKKGSISKSVDKKIVEVTKKELDKHKEDLAENPMATPSEKWFFPLVVEAGDELTNDELDEALKQTEVITAFYDKTQVSSVKDSDENVEDEDENADDLPF